MRPVRCLSLLICTSLLCLSSIATADQPAVWTGLTYSFTSTVDSPAQDMITPNVRFARSTTRGLFNAASEDFYMDYSSPASTVWATEFNNDLGANISASNWASLNFTDWQTAYGGVGSLTSSITQSNAVVYLESDNVYLDLRFTQWGNGRAGGGGSFSYQRAEAVPEPAAVALFAVGAMGCAAVGRRRPRNP